MTTPLGETFKLPDEPEPAKAARRVPKGFVAGTVTGGNRILIQVDCIRSIVERGSASIIVSYTGPEDWWVALADNYDDFLARLAEALE